MDDESNFDDCAGCKAYFKVIANNQKLQDALEAEREKSARLVALLQGVEFVGGDNEYCPWCGNSDRYGHANDCPRQEALKGGE